MWKRRFWGALTITSIVLLAACPPRDRVDERERVADDTIVPTAPPEVVPVPRDVPPDTPMIVDTPMVRDTPGMTMDTPQVGTPRQP